MNLFYKESRSNKKDFFFNLFFFGGGGGLEMVGGRGAELVIF